MSPTSDHRGVTTAGPEWRGAVLVTGASSGIGRSTALTLARAGFSTFGAVRADSDGAALAADSNGRVRPVRLDVTDPEQIQTVADLLTRELGDRGLVGLVNNAGVGLTGPLELLSLDRFRGLLEVNVVGPLALTQSLLPLLRVGHGRVVNIGSVGGRITMPFAGPLNASKYAVVALNDALRMELAPWHVDVVLVEPASIRTRAVDTLAADVDGTVAALPPDRRPLYEHRYRTMVGHAVARERRGSPPDVVADTVLTALTASRPRTRYPVGKDARVLLTAAHLLPDRLLDRVRLRVLGVPTAGPRAQQQRPTTAAPDAVSPPTSRSKLRVRLPHRR